MDIDEDRLKLLLSNDKYRTKLIMLLNDLERNSWTKFFTIPCNTINLLWSLFWQRKINRALVEY